MRTTQLDLRVPSFSDKARVSFQLVQLLDDDDRPTPQLGRQQRQLDVLAVLVAVADQQRARLVVDRQHAEQLGLAADLERQRPFDPAFAHALDDVELLVDLDRIGQVVGAAILGLGDGLGERPLNITHATVQDLIETE